MLVQSIKTKIKLLRFKKYVDNGYYDEAKLILELESDPALKEKISSYEIYCYS